MIVQTIVNKINHLLAGELLSTKELEPILDSVIDLINNELNSTFPVISEMPVGKADYDYFPDRYIRTVVVPGAAWKYLVVDEEGISTATQFQIDFEKGLYYMVRDYMANIPEEYKALTDGAVPFIAEQQQGERGLHVSGNNFFL